MFKEFGRRLQRDIKKVVDARLKLSETLSGGHIKVRREFISIKFTSMNAVLIDDFLSQPKPIDVQVVSHSRQRNAVWFGGSMLASTVSC